MAQSSSMLVAVSISLKKHLKLPSFMTGEVSLITCRKKTASLKIVDDKNISNKPCGDKIVVH